MPAALSRKSYSPYRPIQRKDHADIRADVISIMVNYHIVRSRVAEDHSDLMVILSLIFLSQKSLHTYICLYYRFTRVYIFNHPIARNDVIIIGA